MQPGVPNKPMPQQPQPPYGGGNSSGRGCGCFAFGCGGVLLGLVGLCVAGYYTLFFSNVPLAMIKQALEESGNVKIDGLKGNFSSGFEMKAIRFKDPQQKTDGKTEGKWSELNDIRVKYRNGGMFASSFTVEDISIAGGTIYSDLNFDGELSGDLVFDELQDEFGDFQSDFSGSSRGTLEIKNISFRGLKICDPKTDDEFHIDDITLKDVLIENGRLVEFGDLVVKADMVELDTIRSANIADAQLERTVKGRLQRGILSNVLTDLPFEIEFGVLGNGKIAARSRWFDGKILSVSGFADEPNRYQLTGFSPAEHIRVRGAGVVPTEINLDVIYDAKKRQRIAGVESSGHLLLGISRLENFRLPETSDDSTARQFILATTEVEGKQVEAELYLLSQFPLVGVKLRNAADWSLEETWAKTVFGKPYGDLTNEQKDELQASIAQAEREFKNRTRREDGEMERGRGKSIVTPGEEETPSEKSSDDVPESDKDDSKEQMEKSEADGRSEVELSRRVGQAGR
jgi:hypothetical protein